MRGKMKFFYGRKPDLEMREVKRKREEKTENEPYGIVHKNQFKKRSNI